MFKNLTIGARLAILVAVLSVSMVVVGLIGLTGMRSGNDALDTVYNDRVVPLRDLKVIADMYSVNIVDTAHQARNGNVTHAEAIRNIDQAGETIRKTWAGYLATFLVPEEKALVARIEPQMVVADRAAAQLRAILERGDADALAAFSVRSLYPAITPIADLISELIELQLTVAKQTYDAEDATYERDRLRMIGLIAAALLAGAAIGVAVIRSITRPLAYASGLITAMAEGRLDAEITDDGRRDELGRMIRATAHISGTLRAVAKDLRDMIDAARAGALSVRAEPERHRGEFAVLVGGVNDLVEVLSAPLFEVAAVMAKLAAGDVRGRMAGAYDGDLRALKGNVNRSLDTLVSLLDEVAAFAAAMARGDLTAGVHGSYQGDFASLKTNLTKAAAELAGVVGQVSASTQQVADAAAETTAAAVDVSRQAAGQMVTLADVSAAIEQTVSAVGEIARSAERGSALARGAVASAEEGRSRLVSLTGAVDSIATGNARIGQISALIADIAEKTYVLAINTGLEALRAGDQGKGFGLIASQITRLAEEAGQATRDIRALLEDTGRSVQAGVETAREAGLSMARIVDASQESGATAQAIAAAIEEQNAMAQLLKERVLTLHMTGQTTASAAEQISATMGSLKDLAQRLKAESDRLRVA